ncbi:hypothetical protein BB559_000678 [Furculomyces boomerangus]|uniref:DNA helicase n=1 Tax=Furculomyces boomerangus TaxID=61424 RepID=A0A2T9Z4F4_9FUNG|nr:hypothetical protein BB559_000678 [Furculomyces boomerangus]
MDTINLDSDFDFEIDDEILKIVQDAEVQCIHPDEKKESSNPKNDQEVFATSLSSDFSDSLINQINWEEVEKKTSENIRIDNNKLPATFVYSSEGYIDQDKNETHNNNLLIRNQNSSELKQNIGKNNFFDKYTRNTNTNSSLTLKPNLEYSSNSTEKINNNKELGPIPVLPTKNAIELHHEYDGSAILSYLYPLIDGQQVRAYQQMAILKCLKENTLVSLPTGLGKTFIAAVVMANYARWFPEGLMIFLAPSRPLVTQQAKACAPILWTILQQNNPMIDSLESQLMESRMILSDTKIHDEEFEFLLNGRNVSGSIICEMNGSLHPSKRKLAWSKSRFVFATPQTVQNDLKTGILESENINRITLLVVDEAHRTRGNYAFGACMDELTKHYGISQRSKNKTKNILPTDINQDKSYFRVIALTATPGTDVKSVQNIVDRLHLAGGFIRTEQSLDVSSYLHGRRMVELIVVLPQWHQAILNLLIEIAKNPITKLSNDYKVMPTLRDIKSIIPYTIMMHTKRWSSYQSGRNQRGNLDAAVWAATMLSIKLLQIIQLLQTQSFLSAYRYIRELSKESDLIKRSEKSTVNQTKVECLESPEFKKLEKVCFLVWKRINSKSPEIENRLPAEICGIKIPLGHIYSHPKLESLVDLLKKHFNENDKNSKVIVFTQYRESVDEIAAVLKFYEPLINAAAFVGQNKSNAGGSDELGFENDLFDLENQPEYTSIQMNGSQSTTTNKNKRLKESSNGNPFNQNRGANRGGYQGRGRGRGRGRIKTQGNYSRKDTQSNVKNNFFNNPNQALTNINGNFDKDMLGNGYNNILEDISNTKANSSSNNFQKGIDGFYSANTVGRRGQTQKEQQEVVDNFAKGVYNVLVATCVAEEGLDIGEVDLIVHYDAPRSPIQLLQRTGRTGRSRKGGAIVMLTGGTTEQLKYNDAVRKYNSVQQQINKAGTICWHSNLSAKMVPDYKKFLGVFSTVWPRRVDLVVGKNNFETALKMGNMGLMSKKDIKKSVSDDKKQALKQLKIDKENLLSKNPKTKGKSSKSFKIKKDFLESSFSSDSSNDTIFKKPKQTTKDLELTTENKIPMKGVKSRSEAMESLLAIREKNLKLVDTIRKKNKSESIIIEENEHKSDIDENLSAKKDKRINGNGTDNQKFFSSMGSFSKLLDSEVSSDDETMIKSNDEMESDFLSHIESDTEPSNEKEIFGDTIFDPKGKLNEKKNSFLAKKLNTKNSEVIHQNLDHFLDKCNNADHNVIDQGSTIYKGKANQNEYCVKEIDLYTEEFEIMETPDKVKSYDYISESEIQEIEKAFEESRIHLNAVAKNKTNINPDKMNDVVCLSSEGGTDKEAENEIFEDTLNLKKPTDSVLNYNKPKLNEYPSFKLTESKKDSEKLDVSKYNIFSGKDPIRKSDQSNHTSSSKLFDSLETLSINEKIIPERNIGTTKLTRDNLGIPTFSIMKTPEKTPQKIQRKNSKPKKLRKKTNSSINKFLDVEAHSDSETDDDTVKAAKKHYSGHLSEETDGSDLDSELGDGFVVSDGHVSYKSSQSISSSQITSNQSDVYPKTSLGAMPIVQISNNPKYLTPKKKPRKNPKKPLQTDIDGISLYRQVNNNETTPLSQLHRRVQAWEQEYIDRQNELKNFSPLSLIKRHGNETFVDFSGFKNGSIKSGLGMSTNSDKYGIGRQVDNISNDHDDFDFLENPEMDHNYLATSESSSFFDTKNSLPDDFDKMLDNAFSSKDMLSK